MAIITGPDLAAGPGRSTDRHTTAQSPLGVKQVGHEVNTMGVTTAGSKSYVYCRALVATTASGQTVGIATDFDNVQLGDLDLAQSFLGIAEAPLASGEYGWVQTEGVANAVVASGASAGQLLEMSGTAGELKPITTSGRAVAVALETSFAQADGLTLVYLF